MSGSSDTAGKLSSQGTLRSSVTSLNQSMATSTTNFSDLQICIAIDTSGSTEGVPVKKEANAALAISRLLSPENQNHVQVLPWNGNTSDIVTLQKGASELPLRANGGTRPLCILQDTKYVTAL